MSKRVKQVNEFIRSNIGRIILEEIEVPNNIVVTVVKVDTAPDLKNADVYLSIIPDNKSQKAFDNICRQVGRIQHLLAQKITFKFAPKIHLKLDYTERNASHIEEILDNLE